MGSKTSRRDFIKNSALAGTAAVLGSKVLSCSKAEGVNPGALTGPIQEFTAKPIKNVRIGYAGCGGMGSAHISNLMRIPGCEITALCDIVPEKVER